MGDFQEKIIGGTYGKGNQVISPEAVVSNTFLADYFRAAEKYAQYNTRNNYGSSSYSKHTTVKTVWPPKSNTRYIQKSKEKV